MVPAMEAMGIRMLLNECEVIVHGDHRVFLAGIDDAHFFRVDNIEKAALQIPSDEFSILLSHTPEVYRQAAHAHFNLMLSGHTHGGQLCLPGSGDIAFGAYATARLHPADRLVRIPAGVSDDQAASAFLKGLTARYLLKEVLELRPGDTVLYHAAAGGVGQIFVQWAKALGLKVIG